MTIAANFHERIIICLPTKVMCLQHSPRLFFQNNRIVFAANYTDGIIFSEPLNCPLSAAFTANFPLFLRITLEFAFLAILFVRHFSLLLSEDYSIQFLERLTAGRKPVERVRISLEFVEFAADIFDAAAFEFGQV